MGNPFSDFDDIDPSGGAGHGRPAPGEYVVQFMDGKLVDGQYGLKAISVFKILAVLEGDEDELGRTRDFSFALDGANKKLGAADAKACIGAAQGLDPVKQKDEIKRQVTGDVMLLSFPREGAGESALVGKIARVRAISNTSKSGNEYVVSRWSSAQPEDEGASSSPPAPPAPATPAPSPLEKAKAEGYQPHPDNPAYVYKGTEVRPLTDFA